MSYWSKAATSTCTSSTAKKRSREFTAPQTPAVSTDKLPYLKSSVLIALTGCVAYGLRSLHLADAEANTVMLFLAAVAWTAFRYGRGPAILASVLAVIVFDFFFVPPFHTFAVADAQYVVTFAVMLTIGLVISTLTSRLRAQVESTRQRERRTSALYELGKQLSSLYGERVSGLVPRERRLRRCSAERLPSTCRQPSGTPELAFGHNSSIAKHAVSLPVAQWVIEHDQIAGAGTNTLPNAVALFLPLTGSQRTHGAIAMRVPDAERLLDPDVRRLLEACANQLALALERDQLAIDAAEARIQAEAEQVRSSLLSSVSHDLKTPLAAIAGASSSLLEVGVPRRRDSPATAGNRGRRSRPTQSAARKHPSNVEAGCGSCDAATSNGMFWRKSSVRPCIELGVNWQITKSPCDCPVDLPLVFVDGLLMEQVFVNLAGKRRRVHAGGNDRDNPCGRRWEAYPHLRLRRWPWIACR